MKEEEKEVELTQSSTDFLPSQNHVILVRQDPLRDLDLHLVHIVPIRILVRILVRVLILLVEAKEKTEEGTTAKEEDILRKGNMRRIVLTLLLFPK